MASGQVNRANKGRTHGRTDQCCIREENPCQLGAVHTWPLASFRARASNGRSWSNNGHRAAEARNPSVANDPTETLGAQPSPVFGRLSAC
jgi:hypothetical protein